MSEANRKRAEADSLESQGPRLRYAPPPWEPRSEGGSGGAQEAHPVWRLNEANRRPVLLAITALVCSILALILSAWAAYDSARTRDEIRRLGDLLAEPRSGAMKLEVTSPPELDPDDR